jgi:hypothetical protein
MKLTSSLKNCPCKSRAFWQNQTMIGGVFCHEEIEVHGGAIIFALRQAEMGTSVAEVCRKMDNVKYLSLF